MTAPLSRHWRSAADALAVLRREPGLTRAELGPLIALKSGPTSDLVKRLTAAGLIVERAAPGGRRGRPTTTVHAAPAGPVALVVDVRHGDWRLGTCAVDGEVELLATGAHDGLRPDDLLDEIRARLSASARELGERLVGVGIAVPGPTAGSRLVHATMLGWRDVDLSRVAPDLPLVVANDATVAAIAEARLHSPRPRTLLHVVVEIGIGGALVVDGRPVPSARGLQGEFGHVPFGEPAADCPCGARGCWTVPFNVESVAAASGTAAPAADPRRWLHGLFTDSTPAPDVRTLRDTLAADLGRGIAGYVNALDPDLVTLGGLAGELRDAAPAAFEGGFDAGLMAVHRAQPPAVVAARGGEDAPLIGLGLSVFDLVVDADMLARWEARRQVTT